MKSGQTIYREYPADKGWALFWACIFSGAVVPVGVHWFVTPVFKGDFLVFWAIVICIGFACLAFYKAGQALKSASLQVTPELYSRRVTRFGRPLLHERVPTDAYQLIWAYPLIETVVNALPQDATEQLFISPRHDPYAVLGIDPATRRRDAEALAKTLGINLRVGFVEEPDFAALAVTPPPANLAVSKTPQGWVIRTAPAPLTALGKGSGLVGLVLLAITMVPGLVSSPAVGEFGILGLAIFSLLCWLPAAFGKTPVRGQEVRWCADRVELSQKRFKYSCAPHEIGAVKINHIERVTVWYSKYSWDEFEVVIETPKDQRTWFRSGDQESVRWVIAALTALREGQPIHE